MYAMLVILALGAAGDDCESPPPKQPPSAKYCYQWSAPTRCFCKACAGCGGNLCLSCSQPYFGSQPYNYRIQFDYPWSQRPAYPYMHPMPLAEEIEGQPEFGDPRFGIPEEIEGPLEVPTEAKIKKPRPALARRPRS
jgi:hypothetical protein